MNTPGRIALSIVMWTMAVGSAGCKGKSAVVADISQPSTEASQVLSWLPSDTETLITARGPFLLPGPPKDRQKYEERITDARELQEIFRSLALGPLALNNGGLEKQLMGARVRLAAEGSRAFRPPHDLGELLYEGCTVVMFIDDITDRERAFMKDAAKNALRIEDIASHKVAVFQQEMERDTWTTFVAFPTKNVVIVATNQDYLREVLARMDAPKTDKAFPGTLPEWKYIATQAEFWGMRHFDKSQARLDPTSPYGGRKSANLPDEGAIGLTFQCDPAKELKANLVYLTDSKNKAMEVERQRFPPGAEVEGTTGLHIGYRNLSPGVIETSYDLSRPRSSDWFFFVFMAQLGHAVYV